MAINKQRKEELVEQYVDMLQKAKGVVVAEYRGMTVRQLDDLRAKLRENNASFTVTKNTLLKIALEQVGMAVPDTMLAGPVALAVAYDDLPKAVKTILEHANTVDLLIIKGGILGQTIVPEGDLDALSKLPSLDELRAQLAGMVTMPITQFLGLLEEPGRQVVGVIHAATTGIVNVLEAYVQKEEAA